MSSTGELFERAVAIMRRLREPGGCPWDREQTFDTIKPFTLEEAYEVIEAIDNRDWDELPGELGDLLLQILFYAQMAQEERRFTIDDVIETLSTKLVNRHPHVFGDVEANTSAEVLRNWEILKAQEKEKRAEATGKLKDDKKKSLLGSVSAGLPGLIEAGKISTKAAEVGFEWPQIEQLFEKLTEETVELREELKHFPDSNPPPPNARGIASSSGEAPIPAEVRARLEDEIGDLLFTVVNLARYVRVDPESALKRTNRKFRSRFRAMEALAGTAKLQDLSLGGVGGAVASIEALGTEPLVKETPVIIRVCTELNEWEQCVRLQQEVWGFSDLDLVPLRMFSVASKIGGHVIGAYDGELLVGFALAIPGSRNGYSYLHSHMLAVAESHRNLGLGRKIKLFQREDAISRGYELMEWTFDPLEIKNAYLNLTKLGAIARRYNINQYGITSSPLQGFLPTDRLVAEWWLKSRRVKTLLQTGALPTIPVDLRITVPSAIYQWKAEEPTRARAKEVQSRNRDLFLESFDQGLTCLAYERDAVGNGSFLIGRWDETWSYANKGNPHED